MYLINSDAWFVIRTVIIIKIEFQDILLIDFADISDVHDVTDPLTKVKAGLVSNDDTPVTLLEAHIRAKLIDLAGEVNNYIHTLYPVLTNLNKATSTRAWTLAVFVKLGFDEGRVYSRPTVQSLAKWYEYIERNNLCPTLSRDEYFS